VHLEQLHINNIEINLPISEPVSEDPKPESGPLEIPDIKLPVAIALDDIQINHISIQTATAEPFIIDNIILQSQTSDHLTLQNFQVTAPLFNIKLIGKVGFIKPHAVQLDLNWNANLPEFKLVGQGEVTGDMEKITLIHHVREPLAIDLQTTVTDLLGDLNLDAKLTWSEIYWPLDIPEKIVISQQGKINITGGLDDYNFALRTKVDGQQIPESNWRITGQGNQQQVTINTLHSELLEGLLDVQGQFSWTPKMIGNLNLNLQAISIKEFWQDWPDQLTIDSKISAKLDGDKFQINDFIINIPQTNTEIALKAGGLIAGDNSTIENATLNWQGLQWPLVGGELINSKQGQVDITGTMKNYQVALATQIDGGQVPTSNITLQGKGDLQQFTVESLQTKLLEGEINTSGAVSWKPKLVGQLELAVEKLNLQEVWQDWPNKLRLDTKLIANLDGDKFKLESLQVNLPNTQADIILIANGKLGKVPSFNATMDWKALQWPLVGKKSLVTSKNGKITLSGNTENYQLNMTTQVDGKQVPASKIKLSGQGDLQHFTINSLYTKTLQGAINADGEVNWKPTLVAQLNLDVDKISLQEVWPDWPQGLNLNAGLVAGLKGDNFKINKLDVSIPQTGMELSLTGSGSTDGKTFAAALNWQDLQWPLNDGKIVNSKVGIFNIDGGIDSYKLQLDTKLKGIDIPAGHWRAKGYGNDKSLQLSSLQGDILQGILDLSGHVQWQPSLNWQLTLQGKNLNPGEQWSKWPGKLAMNIQTQGNMDKQLFTTLQIKQLDGKLRDYPLDLKTDININGNNYKINKLKFSSGKSYLTANGNLGNKSNLIWELNTPDLQTFLPDAKGSIIGKGSLTGPLNLPHIKVQLEANSIVFQQNDLQQLTADMDVNLGGSQKIDLEIAATNLVAGATQIDSINLQGKGSLPKHTITANLNLPTDDFMLQLKGGLKQMSSWQGKLQQINLNTEKVDDWKLVKPTQLLLSADKVQLDKSCLQNIKTAGKLCTKVNWSGKSGSELQVDIKKLSLELLQAVLPEDMNIKNGAINGSLQTTLRPDGKINSKVAVNISPGVFSIATDDKIEKLKFAGGNLNLKINDKGLNGGLKLKMLNHSYINGQIKLPKLTHVPPVGKQPIKGNLTVKFDDLDILPTFVPQAENTQGQVEIAIKVAGSLDKPKLEGKIQVVDVATELPDLGLILK
ncbi:MAG: hypothetical protein KAG43_09335, partial [Candidatus Marithrix sp.]|nr:hypothetical protein [Candidatus Marithrix sp.]